MTKNKRTKSSKTSSSKPKVKKTKSTTDNSGNSVFNLTKKNLDRYANLFAEDKPGTLSFQPDDQERPISVLLRNAEDLLFARGCSERPTDSIQEDLIVNMRKSGMDGIDQEYEDARKSARRVLFNICTRQIVAYLNEEGGNLKKALNRALLIDDPNILYSSEDISDWVADGIVNGGSKFLRRLSDDFRNAERRSFRLAFDPVTYALALNWTNPHCPLWLMKRPAIFKACNSLYPRITTQDAVNKRLKTKGLGMKSASSFKRNSKCPIEDIVLSANTKTIEGFVLEGIFLDDLDGKRYSFSHAPHKGLTRKADAQKELAQNTAWQELSANVKKLGVDTDEAAKAIRAFVSKFDAPQTHLLGYQVQLKKAGTIRPTKKTVASRHRS
jgi:hypothetical protein